MNKELFDKGLAIRKSVIGAEFVDKALASADAFNMPLQELVTEYSWQSPFLHYGQWNQGHQGFLRRE